MSNKWKIPEELEKEVRERDKFCVYCRVEMKNNSKDKATWEHMDNDETNVSKPNITLCCYSCNRSKSNKNLLDWLESSYCKEKKVKEKMAKIIQDYIKEFC